MRIYVALEVATATEATALARALEQTPIGFSLGAGLLTRLGAPIVTAIRPFGPVLADARIGGDASTVARAAKALAASGAETVVLGSGTGPDVANAAVDAVRPHAASVAIAVVDPHATGPDTDVATAGLGRGRGVSRAASALAGTGVRFLGSLSDVGVVAQVAPEIRVIVAAITRPDEVAEAIQRGAVGVVIDPRALDLKQPAASMEPFVRVVRGG